MKLMGFELRPRMQFAFWMAAALIPPLSVAQIALPPLPVGGRVGTVSDSTVVVFRTFDLPQVYHWDQDQWHLEVELDPGDDPSCGDPPFEAWAAAAHGDRIVLGTRDAIARDGRKGVFFVFERGRESWRRTACFTPPGYADNYGYHLALWGNWVAVAPWYYGSTIYLYRYDGRSQWKLHQSVTAPGLNLSRVIALNNETLLAGSTEEEAVFFERQTNDEWVPVLTVPSQSYGLSNRHLAIHGQEAFVGDGNQVVIYGRGSEGWSAVDTLHLPWSAADGVNEISASATHITVSGSRWTAGSSPALLFERMAGQFISRGVLEVVGHGGSVQATGLSERLAAADTAIYDLRLPATAPEAVSPADGANVDISPVALSWRAVPEATSYEVRLGSESTSTADTSLVVAMPLRPAAYLWRVRADLPGGKTPWSYRTFSWKGSESGWLPPFHSGAPNDTVYAIVPVRTPSRDLVYIAGRFTAVGEEPVKYLSLFDGYGWSSPGRGVNGPVPVLEYCEDPRPQFPGAGLLYVAGEFTEAGGKPAAGLARWDGTAWSVPSEEIDGKVSSLSCADEGVFVGGNFVVRGSPERRNLVRWSDGNYLHQVHNFRSPVLTLLGPSRYGSGIYTGLSGLYVGLAHPSGGYGNPAECEIPGCVARGSPAGTGMSAITPLLPADSLSGVSHLAFGRDPHRKSDLYVGGSIDFNINGRRFHGLARFDDDGPNQTWTQVGEWDGPVDATETNHIGYVYVSGRDKGRSAVKRWSGGVWVTYADSIDGRVLALGTYVPSSASEPTDRIYAGGAFTLPTEADAQNVAVLYVHSGVGRERDPEVPTHDPKLEVFPNPAGATATVAYTLQRTQNVRLIVYDVLGREIEVLADGLQPAGRHEVTLDAGRLSTGTYLCILTANGNSVTKLLTRLK